MLSFTKIVSELICLGETISKKEAVRKFLRSTPAQFDSLTLTMTQFGDMSKMTLDKVVGSLVVQEQRLHERQVREEKQSLLTRAMGKEKVKLGEESSSRGRGCGRGRGKGRGQG